MYIAQHSSTIVRLTLKKRRKKEEKWSKRNVSFVNFRIIKIVLRATAASGKMNPSALFRKQVNMFQLGEILPFLHALIFLSSFLSLCVLRKMDFKR